jgi:hypothetical protein
MKKISRRSMLKASGAAAAGVLLATTGCAPTAPQTAPQQNTLPPALAEPTLAPTSVEKPTIAPTIPPAKAADSTITPTVVAKTYRRPEIIKFHPDTKSRVVRASDHAAWNGNALAPDVLRKMVDGSIIGLTGQPDARAAWLALFDPTEHIAIKVNAFRNSTIWTHVALVNTVTDSMQAAGIPGEQITLFDFYDDELTTAGFSLNRDGPGVRCYGTEHDYSTSWDLGGKTVKLSDILVNADALINMPVLKSHMIAGMTFTLKNHYGSVSYPDGLHNIAKSLPALNKLAPIREATRLVIGDVLEANTKYASSWPYWEADVKGDSILMSYDPLAADMVGWDMLQKLCQDNGSPTKGLIGMAQPWIKTCGEAGLGANDMANIELLEI